MTRLGEQLKSHQLIMKSVKNWLLLLVIYVAYLVIGGFLFHHTECPAEVQEKLDTWRSDSELVRAVLDMKDSLSEAQDIANLDFILDHVIVRYQLGTIEANLTDRIIKCSKWDFENSLFFSFTVVTTIGREETLCQLAVSNSCMSQGMATSPPPLRRGEWPALPTLSLVFH